MPVYEVSRTLVKSPPEVWSELEKVERLAELLGDGTIEIVSAKPENRIDWRGERASGSIEISASGWGTKVRLTAEAQTETEPAAPTQPQPDVIEPESAEDVEIVAEEPAPEEVAAEEAAPVEPVTEEAAPGDVVPDETVVAEEDAVLDQPAESAAAEPERVGFWSRIFGRKTSEPTATESATDPAEGDPEPETPVGEPVVEAVAEPEPEALVDDEPEPEAETAAEPIDFEAVLTGVLDHLGSAHKRPFTQA